MNQKKIFLFCRHHLHTCFGLMLLLFQCVYVQPLGASSWSKPSTLLGPKLSSTHTLGLSLATNGDGACIAVWFDQSGMQAATFSRESIDTKGRPSWTLTKPLHTSYSQTALDTAIKSVGIDLAGNAMAAWKDADNHILVSKLPAGENEWMEPVIICSHETFSTSWPSVAVASCGNTVVTWTCEISPNQYRPFSNAYDARLRVWKGQRELLEGSSYPKSSINPAAVDAYGNAIAVIGSSSDTVQAMRFDFKSNTWTAIAPIATGSALKAQVAVDLFGNATILWIQEDSNVLTATLARNARTFSKTTQLSTRGKYNPARGRLPQAAVDGSGNVVAAWPEMSGNIATAQYSYKSGSWISLKAIKSSKALYSKTIPSNISLSVDQLGNAAILWNSCTHGQSHVQSALLPANTTSWYGPTQLSTNSDMLTVPHVVMNSLGDAVALWKHNTIQGDNNGNKEGIIKSSIFVGSLIPPSHFMGMVKKRYRSKKVERIHHLSWTASKDPSICKYMLYKNSKKIAVIKAGKKNYGVNLRHCSRKKTVLYRLVAVGDHHNATSPLSVILP